MTYEELLMEADSQNLIVKEKNIPGYRGRIFRNRIAIHKNIPTLKEKACVLAEELGHHYTTCGNIIEQNTILNQKQELRARAHAYDKMIGLSGIIKCFEYGCRTRYEMAEHLNVTEEFLNETLIRYRNKYGHYVLHEKYAICFEPNLTVLKMK